MRNFVLFCFSIAVLGNGILSYSSEDGAPFHVGEKWIYQHEGPRPWSKNEPVNGDRVREVISTEGAGDQQVWIISEHWGTSDEHGTKFYYDEEKKLEKQEVGYDFVIRFNPPYPNLNSLVPGEEKIYEIKSSMGGEGRGHSFPMQITAKRIEDETLVVPAGEFTDCHHVQAEQTITFKTETGDFELKLKHEIWFHEDANGAVKEKWEFLPVQFGNTKRPGYTCVSELSKHIAGEK